MPKYDCSLYIYLHAVSCYIHVCTGLPMQYLSTQRMHAILRTCAFQSAEIEALIDPDLTGIVIATAKLGTRPTLEQHALTPLS